MIVSFVSMIASRTMNMFFVVVMIVVAVGAMNMRFSCSSNRKVDKEARPIKRIRLLVEVLNNLVKGRVEVGSLYAIDEELSFHEVEYLRIDVRAHQDESMWGFGKVLVESDSEARLGVGALLFVQSEGREEPGGADLLEEEEFYTTSLAKKRDSEGRELGDLFEDGKEGISFDNASKAKARSMVRMPDLLDFVGCLILQELQFNHAVQVSRRSDCLRSQFCDSRGSLVFRLVFARCRQAILLVNLIQHSRELFHSHQSAGGHLFGSGSVKTGFNRRDRIRALQIDSTAVLSL